MQFDVTEIYWHSGKYWRSIMRIASQEVAPGSERRSSQSNPRRAFQRFAAAAAAGKTVCVWAMIQSVGCADASLVNSGRLVQLLYSANLAHLTCWKAAEARRRRPLIQAERNFPAQTSEWRSTLSSCQPRGLKSLSSRGSKI